MTAKLFSASEVRETRERYGLTQQDLAAELDVSIGTVQAFENGRVGKRSRLHKLIEDWLTKHQAATRYASSDDPTDEEKALDYAELLRQFSDDLANSTVDLDHRLKQAALNLDYILAKLRQMAPAAKKR